MREESDTKITGFGKYIPLLTWRQWLVLAIFSLAAMGLTWRGIDLQLVQKEFLQDHGEARYVRTVPLPSNRGMVTDRYGEPLAVSTPVSTIWAIPRLLSGNNDKLPELAQLLGTAPTALQNLLDERQDRQFIYLKRHLDPAIAEQIATLKIPGISLGREYHRYYPASEVAAHLVGFTDIDQHGREGIELAYDGLLKGTPGLKRVLKDRLGRTVENIEAVEPAQPGRDIALSIDQRVQYIAYQQLKAAVLQHHAKAGSMVILDAKSGEVLALVNQPSYNPNNRHGKLKLDHFRNRAVTDMFEPGSTIKPFTIAAGLESGKYNPATPIDTRPGFIKVGDHTIKDLGNYGVIDVASVIKKSSNVGATKIAMSIPARELWQLFDKLGFGSSTNTGFPGESSGRLNDYRSWYPVDRATLAFGYGLSVTALQLAQAYTALANDGVMMAARLERLPEPSTGQQVLSARTARQIRTMLEGVVTEGTGQLASVPGYRVAGKTGTVHKTAKHGYAEDHYRSLFAGMIPASRPRLVAVVIIDDPQGKAYYGGMVAAPVFSKVMQETVRLLGVPADAKPVPEYLTAGKP